MFKIKFPTKRIFWIFPVLKINGMAPFCNLFIERPSYKCHNKVHRNIHTHTRMQWISASTCQQAQYHAVATGSVPCSISRDLMFHWRQKLMSMMSLKNLHQPQYRYIRTVDHLVQNIPTGLPSLSTTCHSQSSMTLHDCIFKGSFGKIPHRKLTTMNNKSWKNTLNKAAQTHCYYTQVASKVTQSS